MPFVTFPYEGVQFRLNPCHSILDLSCLPVLTSLYSKDSDCAKADHNDRGQRNIVKTPLAKDLIGALPLPMSY